MNFNWKLTLVGTGLFVTTMFLGLGLTAETEKVNVKIGDNEVSAYNFSQRYNTVEDVWGVIGFNLDDKTMANTKQALKGKLTTYMLNEFMVKDLAQKYGVEVSSKEINDVLKRTNKHKGYSSVERREIIESKLLEIKLYEYFGKQAKVNNSDVEKFYNENKKQFTRGRSVEMQHILLNSEEEANIVYQQLKNGISFEKMAKEKSLDKGSSETGGNIGNLSESSMDKELAKKVFSMKEGETSEPIKTVFGYQIVKILKMHEAKNVELKEVQKLIEKKLRTDAAKERYTKETKEYLANHKIEANN